MFAFSKEIVELTGSIHILEHLTLHVVPCIPGIIVSDGSTSPPLMDYSLHEIEHDGLRYHIDHGPFDDTVV